VLCVSIAVAAGLTMRTRDVEGGVGVVVRLCRAGFGAAAWTCLYVS
jgi:hypothetical protein